MAEKIQFIHGEPVIATTNGQPFSFLRPDPETIHIDDIAESLAKDARYCGKTPGVFYSVAEHSVLCSYGVPDEYAMMALLHDAAEAYTGDDTSPYKKLLAQVTDLPKEIDRCITLAIFKKFGVEPYAVDGIVGTDLLAPCVHEVDQFVYLQERHQLCHPDANKWWDFHGDPDPEYQKIQCHEWLTAKFLFIKRFNELFYGPQRSQSTN